jgi:acyl carrier protein
MTEQIREFLTENFLLNSHDSDFGNDASLLESGIVDSTGVLELVAFVEDAFGIEIAEHEMVPENFDSVNQIVSYVSSKSKS